MKLKYEVLKNENGKYIAKPKWSNAEHTKITLLIKFIDSPNHNPNEIIEYTSSEVDTGWEHSEEMFQRAKSGEFGPIADFIPIVFSPAIVKDRLIFTALYKRNLITFKEARSAIKSGDLPVSVMAFVNSLPEAEQEEILLYFDGETEFDRNHPIIQKVFLGLGYSQEGVVEFWSYAWSLENE